MDINHFEIKIKRRKKNIKRQYKIFLNDYLIIYLKIHPTSVYYAYSAYNAANLIIEIRYQAMFGNDIKIGLSASILSQKL
jgi:hypothetical protein